MHAPTEAAAVLANELRARNAGGALDLPLLPEVAQQVLIASGREEADARGLADLIRRDAAFAAHLLRIANSPAYAPRSPIVSLQQAISRLGLRTIREIAVIISCKTRAFQVKGHEEEVRLLFRHCLAAGLYAQEIARMRRLNVEDSFLAGLLHDVGRPTLIQAALDLQAELGLVLAREDIDHVVGELHEEVGEAMIRSWKLAPRLALAVRHHHHPEQAGEASGAAALVRLADDFAHHAIALRAVSEDDLGRHSAAAELNLYPEHIGALLLRRADVLAQVEAMA